MRSLVGCLAAVLLLAGCTAEPAPEPSVVPASPQAAKSPPDEELLELSRSTYAEYAAVVEGISAGDGTRSDRLRALVTDDQYEAELKALQTLKDLGWRSNGHSVQSNFTLQSVRSSGDSKRWTVYLCSDATAVRYVDASGTDVTPPGRPTVTPLQVRFVADDGSTALIDGVDVWSDDTYCSSP